MHVEIEGLASSITEIVEQFAWLGASLRKSPQRSGLVYCTPVPIRLQGRQDSIGQVSTVNKVADCSLEILFKEEMGLKSFKEVKGRCWNALFRNPVIVKGYPIPRRTEWNTGLEIPLSMMAKLAGTQQVDRFKGRIYIKGFSTMLVPTKLDGDILSWHLLYNKDGSRISYNDDCVGLQHHISCLGLERYRHILGWCSEANIYAGKIICL